MSSVATPDGASEPQGFAHLIEKVTVMHASATWGDAVQDVEAVLGAPGFSDGTGWASFGTVAVSDESGPAWCLLAKTRSLEAVARAAAALGWQVGPVVSGGHEDRRSLTAPTGLQVVAYAPHA